MQPLARKPWNNEIDLMLTNAVLSEIEGLIKLFLNAHFTATLWTTIGSDFYDPKTPPLNSTPSAIVRCVVHIKRKTTDGSNEFNLFAKLNYFNGPNDSISSTGKRWKIKCEIYVVFFFLKCHSFEEYREKSCQLTSSIFL